MSLTLRVGLLSIALLLAGCAGGNGTGASPNSSTSTTAGSSLGATTSASAPPSGAAVASDIDRAFIDMMVPHHESAIEMAGIALERAERQEIVELAGDVISAQQGEIDQLKSWRLQWFGSEATPPMEAMPLMPGVEMPGMGGMHGQNMDMTADIEMLRTAEPFDLEFMKTMIVHHQMAIDAAEIINEETQIDELRALAEDVIAAQQDEIGQMESWIAEWYPDAS